MRGGLEVGEEGGCRGVGGGGGRGGGEGGRVKVEGRGGRLRRGWSYGSVGGRRDQRQHVTDRQGGRETEGRNSDTCRYNTYNHTDWNHIAGLYRGGRTRGVN